jgi:hypothetical protein
MKKLLVAGVAGLMLMVAAGTQTAMAAPWHGAYRGHVEGRTVYRGHDFGRTAYRPVYAQSHYYRAPVFHNYCW